MRLDGISLGHIDVQKIVPLFIETISKKSHDAKLHILRNKGSLVSHIIVEKDPEKDQYWLVAGFPEYRAYLVWAEENKGAISIPCIIQPYSSSTKQRIDLLERMFHYQKSSWIDKHLLINKLINDGEDISRIAKRLGIGSSEIQSYLIHPDIPLHIIDACRKNQGSFLTLESIRRMNVHTSIRHQLYQRSVLPKRHDQRLTKDKLTKLTWLLKRPHFSEIETERQWSIIESALDYPSTLKNNWDLEIKRSLNRPSLTSLSEDFSGEDNWH